MSEATTTKDLVITRVFDAPRELVFKAFTDPDQIAQWFGPEGYSSPGTRSKSTFAWEATSG